MKKTAIMFFGLTVFLNSLVLANQDGISFIAPYDYSFKESELVPIVLKLGRHVDTVAIIRNNVTVFKLSNIKGKEYLCNTLHLLYGPNEIVVDAYEGGFEGKKIASKKITVFFRSDLSKEFRTVPEGFQKRPFHIQDNQRLCLACHEMEVSPKDIKPAKPSDSICYSCHKKITKYDYVHGPTAIWHCLTCHNQDAKPVRYATLHPEKELCFGCHKEKKEEWTPKRFWHGPTATGKCTICHNPHASNNVAWLKKSPWDLCTICHEANSTGRHVVAGYVYGSSHPTKGKKDPLRPTKELSCASCHNPHAGLSRGLFIKDATSTTKLCIMCHQK